MPPTSRPIIADEHRRRSKPQAALATMAALLVAITLALCGCQAQTTPQADLDQSQLEATDAIGIEQPGGDDLDAVADAEGTDDAIAQTIATMSLQEKVSQMVIAYPEDVSGSETSFTPQGEARLAEYPFGGLCFFSGNISGADALKSHISKAQAAAAGSGAGIPLFITTDEEGGGIDYPNAQKGVGGKSGITRLAKAGLAGTERLYPMYYYKDLGVDVAFSNAAIIAGYLEEYGFNWDFAPVADTNSNPTNPVIGYRSYSDDFAQCAELVAAAVEGYESLNMATSLKHFPGHGDTTTDTHLGAATVDKTYYELEAQELVPFEAGIEAGADSVMMGHITVPSVDDEPASLSREWIETILRSNLSFDGIVLTDGLKMGAVANDHANAELAVMCIQAGNDILLLPNDPYGAVDAVIAAVQAGDIDEAAIDEHVTRILTMKQRHGIWTAE